MTNIIVFSIILALRIASTSAGTSCTLEEITKENLEKLALANNELAFNLHRKLASGSSENVFFSPLSISSTLAMLFYGAKGDTAEELRKTLGYEKADIISEVVHETYNRFMSEVLKNGDSSDGNVLNTANAIIVNKNLEVLEDYKKFVVELYNATIREVDFLTEAPKIVDEINTWVEEKTKGKIEKIFDKLSPSTVLILLNAVYFKGKWKTPFNSEYTTNDIFYNNGQEMEGKRVPLMHSTILSSYASMDNFEALELPYEKDDISMLILLPKRLDGVRDLENSLTPEKLCEVQRQLHKTKVEVSLPRFKLLFEKDLTPEVKVLGTHQIFKSGSANFSGMSNSKGIFVNVILHKAIIEVNEKGNEAAATSTVASSRMLPSLPIFNSDHPFLFAILEKGDDSSMVLFLGRVNLL